MSLNHDDNEHRDQDYYVMSDSKCTIIGKVLILILNDETFWVY